MSDDRNRKSRALLIALLALLLLLLCGLLWVYQSIDKSPERRIVEADVPGVKFEFGAYAYADNEGNLVNLVTPVGVAYADDKIYVTLPEADRVVVFEGDGSNGRIFVEDDRSVAKKSLAEYLVLHPTGIDVDENGDVYVASADKAAVSVFSSDGELLREIPVMSPRYLHVHDGLLYVLSKGTLYVLTTDGAEVGQFGTYGRGPDQLAYPGGVTITADGTILIADTNNYRILALSPELEPLWAFGKAAVTQAEQNVRILASPLGITQGSDGLFYVVDALACYLRVFDINGNMIGDPLGERGALDNQFEFPATIDQVEDDLFVVADQGNNRILGVRLSPVGETVVTPEQSQPTTAGAAVIDLN